MMNYESMGFGLSLFIYHRSSRNVPGKWITVALLLRQAGPGRSKTTALEWAAVEAACPETGSGQLLEPSGAR